MLPASRPSVLSGIQPTSVPTLGNYLGAMRHWVKMQDCYRCYYPIVDLHAITVAQDPNILRQNCYLMLAFLLASGLDPKRSALFLQSHVAQHAELAWVLSCFSYMGEMSRMTQFKDKSQRQGQNIGVGLFSYPALMAADILLYQPNFVPVGDDQKQHIELTRNLAERFNHRVQKEVFRVPEALIPAQGARVMDLQNPEGKMSKSAENLKGVLFLDESDKEMTKKFKSAVTDSGTEVRSYAEAGVGLRNLMDIYTALAEISLEQVEQEFSGKMYGHLKLATADLAVAVLGPIRDEAKRLLTDHHYLAEVIAKGAQEAQQQAALVLAKAYDSLGFIARPS